MKILRAVLRWHLKKAQLARKRGDYSARQRHLEIVERLSTQMRNV